MTEMDPAMTAPTDSAMDAAIDAAVNAAVSAHTERIMRALYPELTTTGSAGEIVSGFALFSPQPEHAGAPGWVQGGLSATVLDSFCARMAGVALGMRIATGTFDLRYRQPVLLDGGPYRVEGATEQPRARTIRVVGAIVDTEGRPLVEASGLFIGVAPLSGPNTNRPGD